MNSMTHNTEIISFNGKQSKIKTFFFKDTVVMGQCKQCAKLWPRSCRLTVVFKKESTAKTCPFFHAVQIIKKHFLNVFCLILCAFRFLKKAQHFSSSASTSWYKFHIQTLCSMFKYPAHKYKQVKNNPTPPTAKKSLLFQ